jgi:hypothetical protein
VFGGLDFVCVFVHFASLSRYALPLLAVLSSRSAPGSVRLVMCQKFAFPALSPFLLFWFAVFQHLHASDVEAVTEAVTVRASYALRCIVFVYRFGFRSFSLFSLIRFGMGVVLFLLVLYSFGLGSQCSDLCDNNSFALFKVCATDNQTHFFGSDSVSCYYACNMSIFYAGTCLLPNDCSSRGVGVKGVCQCWDGWGGADCSIPIGTNLCRSRGVVSPVGHCKCNSGYTGSMCDVVVALDLFPYGEVVSAPYQHRQEMVIFNLSSVAVVDVTVSQQDWLNLLIPSNKDMGDVDANVSFVQGDIVVRALGTIKVCCFVFFPKSFFLLFVF